MTSCSIKDGAVHADLSKYGELSVLIPGERCPDGQRLAESAKNIQDGTVVIALKVGMFHAQTVSISCIRYRGNGGMLQAKTIAVAYIVTHG